MSLLPNWVNDIASLSSIVGLIVTGFLLYEAKKLRDSFLMKARLPDIITTLKSIATNLSSIINSYDQSKGDILTDLGRCRSILVNVKPKVSANIKKDIDDLIQKIRKEKNFVLFKMSNISSDYTEDELWNIYTDIQTVIEGLDQHKQDLRWQS